MRVYAKGFYIFLLISSAIALQLLSATASSLSSLEQYTVNNNKYYLNVGGLKDFNSQKEIGANVQNDSSVVLLTTWFGAYPLIREEGGKKGGEQEWCNGGLPQLANLTRHEELIKRDLDAMKIPVDYSGFFVNDYEAWVPSWKYTRPVYRTASVQLAQKMHPNASMPQILLFAQKDYESAALNFLVFTIEKIKKYRPKASGYGYYGYPTVYSYWDINMTRAAEANDKLMPLWETVTAFYPSIYLPYKSNVDEPLKMNEHYLTCKIQESYRIARKVAAGSRKEKGEREKEAKREGKMPLILPYAWYRYHPGEPSALQFLTQLDLWLEFDFPFQVQPLSQEKKKEKENMWLDSSSLINGLIIWGSERNLSDVEATEKYLVANKKIFLESNGSSFLATTAAVAVTVGGRSNHEEEVGKEEKSESEKENETERERLAHHEWRRRKMGGENELQLELDRDIFHPRKSQEEEEEEREKRLETATATVVHKGGNESGSRGRRSPVIPPYKPCSL